MVDLISSKIGLDFICHRQISSRSDFILAFLSILCYNIIKEVIGRIFHLKNIQLYDIVTAERLCKHGRIKEKYN